MWLRYFFIFHQILNKTTKRLAEKRLLEFMCAAYSHSRAEIDAVRWESIMYVQQEKSISKQNSNLVMAKFQKTQFRLERTRRIECFTLEDAKFDRTDIGLSPDM